MEEGAFFSAVFPMRFPEFLSGLDRKKMGESAALINSAEKTQSAVRTPQTGSFSTVHKSCYTWNNQ